LACDGASRLFCEPLPNGINELSRAGAGCRTDPFAVGCDHLFQFGTSRLFPPIFAWEISFLNCIGIRIFWEKMTLGHQHEPWFRIATRCAVQIRKRFGVPDMTTEARIARVFRAALRPRGIAGRRPDDVTVRASEMWIAGMSAYTGSRNRQMLRQYQRALWQRIYREVLPGFAAMDKLTRQYCTSALRRNVKGYLRRRGYKSAIGIRISTAIRPPKCVLSPPSPSPAE
jgi:hypothetical protein